MTRHCAPGDLRAHLMTLRESPNVVMVVCATCGSQFGITRDRKLARRPDSQSAWVLVAVGEIGVTTAPAGDACSPRVRGLIKGLQKRAGLSDAHYRALLREHAGVGSSLELDVAGADRIVRAIEALVGDLAVAS